MAEQTYAQRIKAARKAAGLTQATLADRARIPRRTIEDWETGRRTPPDYVQHLVLDKIRTLTE